MTLTKEDKQQIIGQHGKGEADTGSAEVQIALLTRRINQLTGHLRRTRRITTRGAGCSSSSVAAAGFLNYLQRKDLEGYRALIKELGLRR